MDKGMDMSQQCIDYFNKGYSCSESVLQTGIEHFGIKSDCTPAVASVFGGGVKGLGHVCGAITSTLMLIGIMHGRRSLDDTREVADRVAITFLDFCQEEFGTLMCRDFTGLNFREEVYPSEKCTKIIEANCFPVLKKICDWQDENLE